MLSRITDSFPALAQLEPGAARLLASAMRPVSIAAGTTVFADGMACNGFFLVCEGCVRVQKVAENGREILLYRVERGQTCVLTTNCLMAGTPYGAEGVVENDVQAAHVGSEAFGQLLAMSPVFRQFVFATFSTRIADLLMLIEEVAFGRIDERLSQLLRSRAEGAVGAAAGGQAFLSVTHQDLATELGTAREVISRQLKDFERRGWVRLYRGRIELLPSLGCFHGRHS